MPKLAAHVIFKDQEFGIVAGAGGTQAGATPLTKTVNVVTTIATANDSVRLPENRQLGTLVFVANQHASNNLRVFPPSGDAINQLGTNNALGVGANVRRLFIYVGNNLWVSL